MQKCDKLAMRAQDKGYTHLFMEWKCVTSSSILFSEVY